MSDSATQFYTQLAEFYEELFPAAPETVDLLEQEARVARQERHRAEQTQHNDDTRPHDQPRQDAPARGNESTPPPPRVLDAGCGTGAHLRELLRRGLDGWGLDLSTEMIDIAARHDPDHAHRYRSTDMGNVADHPAGPFHLVYTLGNTISHLPSHDDAYRWIQTVASALTPGGSLVVQFMDVSLLAIGESMNLPELIGTAPGGIVSMERRFTRQSATTLRFDAVLRRPDTETQHSITNTLLVLSTDEVERALQEAGFGKITLNSSSWSRTVCAKLRDGWTT